jgi:hypothetical protein
MPITHVNQLAEAADRFTNYSYIVKTAVATSPATGRWVDASISTGIPKFNPYAGGALTATAMSGSGNAGIFTGPNSDLEKYIYRAGFNFTATNQAVPNYMVFCDYLLFYALVDLSDDAEQTMDNTVTLPRYVSGDGVRAMLVTTVGMDAVNNAITINYTNSDGVSGRTATMGVLSSITVGVMGLTSSSSTSANAVVPFFDLAEGDKGIRSVQSIQCSSSSGGFAALVLVKPLFNLTVCESDTGSEKNMVSEEFRPVRILNDAYLNFICKVGTNRAGNLRGEILTTYI